MQIVTARHRAARPGEPDESAFARARRDRCLATELLRARIAADDLGALELSFALDFAGMTR